MQIAGLPLRKGASYRQVYPASRECAARTKGRLRSLAGKVSLQPLQMAAQGILSHPSNPAGLSLVSSNAVNAMPCKPDASYLPGAPKVICFVL